MSSAVNDGTYQSPLTVEVYVATIRDRKNRAGKIVFYASVRRRGFPDVNKSFTRLTDAKRWAQELELNMSSGRHYVPQIEAERHTLSDAIKRYQEEELPKKGKSAIDEKRQLSYFEERLGNWKLSEISPATLTEIKGKFLREEARYGKRRQPQTWNRYMSALSNVFEMCVRDWQWMESNPLRRVRREREAPGRVRFLTEEERDRLLDACKKSKASNLYLVVVLTLSTGMRRSEVRWLKWEQVDLSRGVILLEKTKNKERRRIPVRGLALELLKEHSRVRRLGCNYLFPGHKTDRTGEPFDLDNFWSHAIKEARIENFRFHDLRHCCASYLAMNGASLLEIAEVLGHKTLQMVKRYAHLAESHTASVVERMNLQIFGS